MVCPYCSTDMEPIELNGKVFCSNCGLTIKTLAEPTRLDPNASVISGYKNPNIAEPPKNDFPAFPDESPAIVNQNMNPLTDGAKEELGIEVVHPEKDLETENNIATIQPEVTANTTDLDINSNIPERLVDVSVAAPSPEIEKLDSNENSDIDSIIKTLSQSELATHKPLPGEVNSEQIKEIDSLAAGGILLDILSDDLTQKENEAEVKVLDAAKKLVKHIKPADISDNKSPQDDKEAEISSKPSTPTAAPKEDRSKTEAEIKEIEEKIHNLKEQSFEVSDKEVKKYDPDALDMTHLKIEHKTSRIVPDNKEIKETIKSAIISTGAQNVTQEISEKQPEIPSDLEVSSNIDIDTGLDNQPINTAETTFDLNTNEVLVEPQTEPTTPPQPEVSIEPKDVKPKNNKRFSLVGLFKTKKPKGAKVSKKATQKSLHDDANIKVESKSSHVSPEYFKKIIETNRAQKHILKAKNTKDKSKKSTKAKGSKKIAILYALIGFICLFLVITTVFIVLNSFKPEARVERAISSATFNTKRPMYIPEGYVLSSADFDSSKNIYTLEYTFVTDKTRKIVFTQTKQSEPAIYINNLVKNDYKDKEFTLKTVSEQDFTEINKYSLIWNRAEMVYTIDATNTIMDNNLLYKMAGSIE